MSETTEPIEAPSYTRMTADVYDAIYAKKNYEAEATALKGIIATYKKYVAYKQRRFGINPVKNFDEVFHGVTQDEYQEIVNKQYELLGKKPRGKSKQKPEKKHIDDLIMATIKQK